MPAKQSPSAGQKPGTEQVGVPPPTAACLLQESRGITTKLLTWSSVEEDLGIYFACMAPTYVTYVLEASDVPGANPNLEDIPG